MKFNPPPERLRKSCSLAAMLRRRAVIGFAAAIVGLTAAACAMPSTPTGLSTSTVQITSSSSSSPSAPAASAVAVQAPASTQPPTTAAPPPPTQAAPPPPPPATSAAPAGPSLCGAPSNPYGYNLCGDGSYITSPASGVCDYFDCIDNFWNGSGHMEECQDGTYSMSGGIRGACSDHGGEDQAVYSG